MARALSPRERPKLQLSFAEHRAMDLARDPSLSPCLAATSTPRAERKSRREPTCLKRLAVPTSSPVFSDRFPHSPQSAQALVAELVDRFGPTPLPGVQRCGRTGFLACAHARAQQPSLSRAVKETHRAGVTSSVMGIAGLEMPLAAMGCR